jgi:hypothetical protein
MNERIVPDCSGPRIVSHYFNAEIQRMGGNQGIGFDTIGPVDCRIEILNIRSMLQEENNTIGLHKNILHRKAQNHR